MRANAPRPLTALIPDDVEPNIPRYGFLTSDTIYEEDHLSQLPEIQKARHANGQKPLGYPYILNNGNVSISSTKFHNDLDDRPPSEPEKRPHLDTSDEEDTDPEIEFCHGHLNMPIPNHVPTTPQPGALPVGPENIDAYVERKSWQIFSSYFFNDGSHTKSPWSTLASWTLS